MKKLLIILLFTICVCSCVKEDDGFTPSLPLVTTTGENTFGCYAGGVLITPRDGTGTFNQADKGMKVYAGTSWNNIGWDEIRVHDFASEQTSRITLHFLRENIEIETIQINESNCLEGVYSLDTFNIHCRVFDFSQGVYKYYCSLPDSGNIIFTKYDDDFISGTFYCTAVNEDNPNDIIEITEGRFDIKFSNLGTSLFP